MELHDVSKLTFVLTHEFCHIKRLDALWKLLAAGVSCLHWFNPLVWVAFVLASRDLEISCDASVVKKLGKHTKKAYAYTLISMVEYQNEITPFYSNFARHAIKERLESLMKTKKASCLGICAAIVLISVLTVNAFSLSIAADDVIDVTTYEISLDLEEKLAALGEVSARGMTFRVGDGSFGERDFLTVGYNYLPVNFSAEEISIMLANVLYEDYNENVDGTVFDIFLRSGYFEKYDNEAHEVRMMWTGWVVMPNFLCLRGGNPREMLVAFDIFADTGEIHSISHNYDRRNDFVK